MFYFGLRNIQSLFLYTLVSCAVVSYCVSHYLLQKEVSLMKAERYTDLFTKKYTNH